MARRGALLALTLTIIIGFTFLVLSRFALPSSTTFATLRALTLCPRSRSLKRAFLARINRSLSHRHLYLVASRIQLIPPSALGLSLLHLPVCLLTSLSFSL
jgi:hypothetical protein